MPDNTGVVFNPLHELMYAHNGVHTFNWWGLAYLTIIASGCLIVVGFGHGRRFQLYIDSLDETNPDIGLLFPTFSTLFLS